MCVSALGWATGLGEGNEETGQGPQNKGPPGASERPWDTNPSLWESSVPNPEATL